MKSSSLNQVVSTLNIVLLFAGYEFFSSVVSLLFGESAPPLMNILYRAFATLICLIVIVYNLGGKHNLGTLKKRSNIPVVALYFLWALLLLRFVADMYFTPGLHVSSENISRTWLYMVVLTIMPMISVSLSFQKINFDASFKWVLILYSITIIISFLLNYNVEAEDISNTDRLSATGLSSIGSGHVGLSAIILSVCYYLKHKTKRPIIIIGIGLVTVLGVIVMLRSGSRGPLLAFMGVIAVFAFSKSKRPIIWLVIFLICLLFYEQIFNAFLSLINVVAPNLYFRFTNKSESGGQFESRLFYYLYAIDAFLESPIIGKQFAIYPSDGEVEMIYAHNLFLDVLMQLGILGGGLMLSIVLGALRRVYHMIKNNGHILWICLLFVQRLFELMVSSSFYYTPIFSIAIILIVYWMSNSKGNDSIMDYQKG